jgi:hypothetical protein
LSDALAGLPDSVEPGRVVVLDQFEELFVLHPDRWRDRGDLFSQVQAALDQDRYLHFLFVLRDDYLAALEALTPRLRDRLNARYHLGGLSSNQALDAVVKPLAISGRTFAPGVAEDLVMALRRQPSEVAGTLSYEGEDVEPVQLQIVCHAFVERLPDDVQEISDEHIAHYADVHQALVGFYEQALVTTVKGRAGVRERRVRLWFERQLITPARTRGLVFRGERETAGLPNQAVDELERQRIVQSEPRGPALWYELTHDRLIDAVLASNRLWYAKRARTVTRRALVAGAAVAVIAVVASLLVLHHRTNSSASSAPNPNEGQIASPGQRADFHVRGHAGQLLTAVMRPDGGFQGQLVLFDPEGRPIGQPSLVGSPQPLISQTLPVDGNYEVEATGRAGSTGSFLMTFAVQSVGSRSVLTGPDAVPGALNSGHQVDIYTFEGRAGSVVRILMGGSVDGILVMVGPSRQAFTQVSDVSGASLIAAILPQDGKYELLASSPTNDTGPYTIQVQQRSENPVPVGPFSGTFSTQNPDAAVRTLRSDTGGLLTVGYPKTSPDTMSLLSSDGRTLMDNGNETGTFAWPLAPGVKYLVAVYSDDFSKGGSYSLTMSLQRPLSLVNGKAQGRLTTPHQYAVYRVDGTSRRSAALLLTPVGRFDADVTIVQPDGAELLSDYDSGSGQSILLSQPLPESGPYLILISAGDSRPGQFHLAVTQQRTTATS